MDNLIMSVSAARPARHRFGRLLRAPFTRRAWTELGYTIINVPLAIVGFVVTVGTFGHPMLLITSAWPVRKLGSASRLLAGRVLGEQVPPPPPLHPRPHVHVRAPQAARLAMLASAEGAHVELNGSRAKVIGVPASRLTEMASQEHIAIEGLKAHNGWLGAALRDAPGWRARGYLVLKLPLSMAGLLTAGLFWLGGLMLLTYPILWKLTQTSPVSPGAFLLVPVGVAALLAAPWLTHAVTAADRSLVRRLLGPTSLAERVHDLEEARAHVVDDSAARLRLIERDLHDGAQAQLVGLAMKLGLAKEKLGGGAVSAAAQGDLDRAAELVDAAHRSAIEAIAELRVLARGIHPPALDNGLADALTTLAARSAVPVELITEIPQRPSAAIETIAYFCAAELLANVAKHSGARHATLEAVHVPGLLRVRVTDDGCGGAIPEAGGGLRGLADRIRAVDGRIEISSPGGGPTAVTVELPSHV
jgi:signal transduction histidine kinase